MKDKKIDYVYDSSNKIYYYKEKIEAPSNNRLSSINDYSYNYILLHLYQIRQAMHKILLFLDHKIS